MTDERRLDLFRLRDKLEAFVAEVRQERPEIPGGGRVGRDKRGARSDGGSIVEPSPR
jgi:hypothetical protein